MIVTCVTVFVRKEHVDDFIQVTIENHRSSVREPGNLRFDFLQSTDDTTRFFLYEAYDSETAADAHKQTPHYAKWRDTVNEWMARPREGVVHRVICPEGVDQW
jgi:autoinducer 2-degrading protein